MPVAAGVSQGNCTLILSAAVCHSDNMSAESVERIDWDDDNVVMELCLRSRAPASRVAQEKAEDYEEEDEEEEKEAGEGPSQEGPQEEATHLFR